MKYRILRALRIIVQIASVTFFYFLFIKTGYFSEKLVLPVNLYFTSNVYLVILISLALKSLVLLSLPFLIMFFLPFIFGRAFCGWICPVGAVLNFFSWVFRNKPRKYKKPPLKYKYILLTISFLLALFSVTFASLLDPITILYKTSTFSLHLAGNKLLTLLSKIWSGFSNWTMLESHSFVLSLTWISLFILIISLNFTESRFWCRYICPYGATLGILSSFSLLKVQINSQKCTQCGICDAICPASATPMTNWNSRECYQCFLCHVKCPENAIFSTFTLKPSKKPAFMPKRRELIFAAVGGLLVASTPDKEFKALKPPGAQEDFYTKCVRCGECMKVCPTNVLQPIPISAGLRYWSAPQLRTDLSYCEYECSLCGQVCPTEALLPVKPEEKKMGVARVDRNVCLPFAYGEYCIVCEEHCPVPEKAIKLIEIETTNIKGERVKLPAPVIDETLCIGCGICETKCPQSPKAIKVHPYEY